MLPSIMAVLFLYSSDVPKTPAVAPPPRVAILKARFSRLMNYQGEVLAVGSDFITIRGREEAAQGDIITRRFPADLLLVKGESDPRESSIHRLSDVKVGDKVLIVIRHVGDVDLCATVGIQRRPGGVVPKSPFEDPDTTFPYHEAMNARQAFEEKGIPLPLKYDPEYQRAVDEAWKVDYLKKREQRIRELEMKAKERIAPMPRPVVRK